MSSAWDSYAWVRKGGERERDRQSTVLIALTTPQWPTKTFQFDSWNRMIALMLVTFSDNPNFSKSEHAGPPLLFQICRVLSHQESCFIYLEARTFIFRLKKYIAVATITTEIVALSPPSKQLDASATSFPRPSYI